MLNPAETRPKPKSVIDQEAKTRRRQADAQIVLGLQHIIGEGESLLGFSRGKISGSIRGKLNLGPEAFFAPMVNVGLTERRVILQHIHGESGRPGDLAPHFFPLADIVSFTFSEIETYGEEPACRLVFRIGADQQVRIRIGGINNVANAKSLTEVFRSLTRTQRTGNSPLQQTCEVCGHILDHPFRFCPYCGDERKDDASHSESESNRLGRPRESTPPVAETPSSSYDESLSHVDDSQAVTVPHYERSLVTAPNLEGEAPQSLSTDDRDAVDFSSPTEMQHHPEESSTAADSISHIDTWERPAPSVDVLSGAEAAYVARAPLSVSSHSENSNRDSEGQTVADPTKNEPVSYASGSRFEPEPVAPSSYREFYQAVLTDEEQAALDSLNGSTVSSNDAEAIGPGIVEAESHAPSDEQAVDDYANDAALLSFASYIPSHEISESSEFVFKGLMDSDKPIEAEITTDSEDAKGNAVDDAPGSNDKTEDTASTSVHSIGDEVAQEATNQIEVFPLSAEIDAVMDVEIRRSPTLEAFSFEPNNSTVSHEDRSDFGEQGESATDVIIEPTQATDQPDTSATVSYLHLDAINSDLAEDSRGLMDEGRLDETIIEHTPNPDVVKDEGKTASQSTFIVPEAQISTSLDPDRSLTSESTDLATAVSPEISSFRSRNFVQDQDGVEPPFEYRSFNDGESAPVHSYDAETAGSQEQPSITAPGVEFEGVTNPSARPVEGPSEPESAMIQLSETELNSTNVETQAASSEIPRPSTPPFTPPKPLFITDGPMLVHVFINRPPIVLNENFSGANATEVVGKIKARIVPGLPWAQRLLVSNMTGLRFAQEIVKRYNEKVGGHLPPPQSCFEFLNTGQVLGFVTIEMT